MTDEKIPWQADQWLVCLKTSHLSDGVFLKNTAPCFFNDGP
jgi:hypothetical protein